ncbi:21275_t:CDS:2 [Gigaspora rosea]|nr:21275_t:CDS:2 [Gigaspora rosea]
MDFVCSIHGVFNSSIVLVLLGIVESRNINIVKVECRRDGQILLVLPKVSSFDDNFTAAVYEGDSHNSNEGSMKADNGLGGRVRGIGFGSLCG